MSGQGAPLLRLPLPPQPQLPLSKGSERLTEEQLLQTARKTRASTQAAHTQAPSTSKACSNSISDSDKI